MGIAAARLADIADALSADVIDEAVALASAHVAHAPTVPPDHLLLVAERRTADDGGRPTGATVHDEAPSPVASSTMTESTLSTFDVLLAAAPADIHRALDVLTLWAADNGLTSYDTTTSRVFALPPRRGVLWFFLPTPRSTRELELDLKKLRSVDRSAARDVSAGLDELGLSPSTDYPRIPHRVLVRRWEAVRDQVLDPYLAAYAV